MRMGTRISSCSSSRPVLTSEERTERVFYALCRPIVARTSLGIPAVWLPPTRRHEPWQQFVYLLFSASPSFDCFLLLSNTAICLAILNSIFTNLMVINLSPKTINIKWCHSNTHFNHWFRTWNLNLRSLPSHFCPIFWIELQLNFACVRFLLENVQCWQ